ncbi:MAG TPA: SpoIID/LytB domain-containing protein [Candidatus Dormibacteraeota bacterium]|jgi:stage II sporulation protein D
MRSRTSVRYVLDRSPRRRRLTASVVACLTCLAAALPAAADSTSDQLQQLRAQEASQKSTLSQLASQQQGAQSALDQLRATLDSRQADLGGAYQQLRALTAQIDDFQGREKSLQRRHDDRVNQFLGATRTTYKRGTSEWMVYLFAASNFSQFLDRLSYVTAIARNDLTQAELLRQERDLIAGQRRKTEELRAQMEPVLAEIAARVTDVEGQYSAQALVASHIEQEQRAQLASLLGIQHREKELEAALAAAQAAAEAAATKGAGRSYGASCPYAAAGTVSFCGHGFGHGVGLGQYGALGMAQAGIGWQRIVTSFYSGATIGAVPDETVRVHLHAAGATVTPLFAGATLEDSGGASLGHVGADSAVNFSRNGDGSIAAVWNGGGNAQASPLRLVPDTAGVFKVSGSGARYRGEAWVDGSSGLKVINHVAVEDYLEGLAEVPSSWPLNAISAQIVAARTYALYHLSSGLYDVEDTTASQVYGGYDREVPQQTAAVANTKGQAIFSQGHLIDAVFSSSDGGHTECASAEWGQGDNPCSPSYLRGVIDNYDVSPLHTWYTPPHKVSEVQGYLMAGGVYNAGQCGVLDHFAITRDASDRARKVDMVGDKGTCTAGVNDFITGLNKGSPSDFIVYGEMFGVTPGNRAWPYF